MPKFEFCHKLGEGVRQSTILYLEKSGKHMTPIGRIRFSYSSGSENQPLPTMRVSGALRGGILDKTITFPLYKDTQIGKGGAGYVEISETLSLRVSGADHPAFR